jgi:hypothetical protein
MPTIQHELARTGLANKRKAELWEDINILRPEYRRVLKEKAEAANADSGTLARIEFRLQSILKQIIRLTKIAKATR